MDLEKEFDKQLAGAKGPVYLMFLGRNVNTFYIAQKLLAAKIVQKTPTVYAYVNELQRSGLIRLVEVEKGKRGPSKLRTADAEPLLETVKGRYAWFEERWLGDFQTLFRNLQGILDHFPMYLSETSNKKVEDLLWGDTLSVFLYFCRRVINECYWLNKVPNVIVSSGISSLEKDYAKGKLKPEVYKLLRKNHFVMAPYDYIQESLKQGAFTQKNLTSLAALSGDPQYDIYETTFSGELFYISMALKDSELAHTLKQHIENAVEYGKQIAKRRSKGSALNP